MKPLRSVIMDGHVVSPGSRPTVARSLRAVPAALLLAGLLLVGAGPAISSVAAICIGPSCTPSGWTQFHNSATRVGYNTAETQLGPSNVAALGVAWTATTGASIVKSSPAIANGVVYVGSDDSKLHAYPVGCATGGTACSPLWTGDTHGFANSSPAATGTAVYVGSSDDNLYAFAVGCNSGGGTCDPLWTAATGGIVDSSPTVVNGVVYVGSEDGKLYAFDANGVTRCSGVPKTCLPLWTGATTFGIYSSPAVSGGVVYVGSEDGMLYAFNVGCSSGGGSCSPVWKATLNGAVFSTPAVSGSVVYAASNQGTLYAFAVGCNTGGGSCPALWTGTTGGGIYSSPAVANGVVYIGSRDDNLYAYAVGCNSGGNACLPLWKGATSQEIRYSSPAVANGLVYVGSWDGMLHAFAVGCNSGGGTCSPLWSGATGGAIDSSPAVANGVVYVGSTNYKLYAFDVPATASFTVHTANPYIPGVTHSLTITAKDADGNVAYGYRGTVHITSTDAKAVLPADYTFTGADAGVHSLQITLKTVGSQTVTATDTVTGTITGLQSGIVVAIGPVTHFSVKTANPYVAGASHSLTVTALDAGNNVVTGYTGTIHLTSTDAQAVLPADYTFLAGDHGTHSALIVLKTAGTQSATATDTVTSSIKGAQTGIVVTPNAAKTLVVSTANPWIAGAGHTVTVTARDAYGNSATGYLGTIHFTSSDASATVPANYTFLPADHGIHSFSAALSPHLVLKTVGSQWVRATDTVSATITGSQTITVS